MIFFFIRLRLQELERESEKLDASFRTYLKRQHLEKSHFNEDVAKILQNYNMRKVMLNQHTPRKRQLSFNIERNVTYPLTHESYQPVEPKEQSTIVDYSDIDEFQNPFRNFNSSSILKTSTPIKNRMVSASDSSSVVHSKPERNGLVDAAKKPNDDGDTGVGDDDEKKDSGSSRGKEAPVTKAKSVAAPIQMEKKDEKGGINNAEESPKDAKKIELHVENSIFGEQIVLNNKTDVTTRNNESTKQNSNVTADIIDESKDIEKVNSDKIADSDFKKDHSPAIKSNNNSQKLLKMNSMKIVSNRSSMTSSGTESTGEQISTGPPKSPSPDDSW